MMVLTLTDIFGRYFGHPVTGTLEINRLMLAVVCALCWAHTQAKKGHITIDLLVKSIPSRARAIADLGTSFIALILFSVIAWKAITFVLLSKRMMEWSDLLQLPIWPFKTILFIGVFALILQLILDVIDHSKELGSRPHVDTAQDIASRRPGVTGID